MNELGKAEKITPLILPNDPSNKNAIAILSGDQFKPATLRGAPVSSNELIKIKTYLCSDKKTFFTKQPEQRLLSFVTMDGDATLLTNLQETDAPGQLPTTTAYIRHKGSYISTPGVLNTPSIELTPAFKDAGKRGTIELLVLVDVKGKAYFLGFLRTLGMGMDEETRDSVSRYHFTPAVNLKNKQKVPAIVAIVQEFTYNP